MQKTAFDGGLGRVICIGYAFDKGPAVSIMHNSETVMLTDLLNVAETIGTVYVVGHNVTWDVRFLWQRYIVNKIPPPSWLRAAARAKPWDIGDTMTMWNPDRDRKVSLDKLCRILGIPSPKEKMDGSKIWEAYKAGKVDEIAAYCRGDVEATRACFQRMIA